jgi:outer membrane receptor protein involved in Fe transport
MNSHPKLSYAIAAILGGAAANVADAATASTSDADSSDAIQEITVTAQRRVENMQDVPITIQALTAETLTQLNVQTFDDFVKYLPNVTAASSGPGQSAIFMRGLSTTLPGTQGSGGVGSFPGVAIYLDDQSGALPGRNLDVYAADLERIEVLEGPQGTLFGAGAESGVLRYITNKPKIDVTEGNVTAAYETTAHGDPSANVQAVLNIPLISDTLAVRGVIYTDSRGGYINNVPGTFTRQGTDFSITDLYGGVVPSGPGSVNSITNADMVGNDINTVTYQGIRVSALYKFNDDWDALLSQSYQEMHSNGVFYEMPHTSSVNPALQQPLPDLSVQLFEPTYDHDKFENTSLTVNGRVGALKIVYTGGFLVRNIDAQQDYTGYSRGVNAAYYQCTPNAFSGTSPATTCYSPGAYWHDREKNQHDSQELRLSTPDDWRLRGILGAFWEEYNIGENIDWFYKSVPACTTTVTTNCLTDVGPPAGAQVNNPAIRPDNESYFDDIIRGYRQKALFGSADFDIIPKTLTLTLGTRYYWINTTEVGFSASSFGCWEDGPPPCTGNQVSGGLSLNGEDSNNETTNRFNTVYKGFRSRANLSWHVTDDALLYYTWSQGFRAGGFNRGSTEFPTASYTFKTPSTFTPDTLVNNEIGWKTEWDDHRYEFNGAIYQENWRNIQVELFLPQDFGNLSFVANGPNYRVRGVEISAIAHPVRGLTFTGSAAWNSSTQLNVAYLNDINGNPITSVHAFGDPGVPLAQSPPFEANLRVRYDWPIGSYNAFAQLGGVHTAHSISSIASVTTAFPDQPGYAYNQPGWTQYDASLGVGKDNWVVHAYGENITDVRADLYENPNQFVDAKTVSRPRTLGVRVTYKF